MRQVGTRMKVLIQSQLYYSIANNKIQSTAEKEDREARCAKHRIARAILSGNNIIQFAFFSIWNVFILGFYDVKR